MNRKIKKGFSLILCLVFLMSLLSPVYAGKPSAPTITGGTLSGRVTDASTGKILVGATVTATGTSGTFTGVTNSRGNYSMNLPAGNYTVTCQSSGFNTASNAATIKDGIKVTLNFSLIPSTSTTGTLTGTVRDILSGTAIAGVTVTASTGGYQAITDSAGKYILANMNAGSYEITANASGYNPAAQTATVNAGETANLDFTLTPVSTALNIVSLTATPDSFIEATTATVSLNAVIEGSAINYTWTQVDGPRVPLNAVSATQASADVSALAAAAETELTFRLTLAGADGKTVSKDVVVYVQPADISPFLGPNVQIGGSSTAVAKFTYNGADWCLFNIGGALKTTPVTTVKGPVYTLQLSGFVYDIDLINFNGKTYALASTGSAGVSVIDVTDPTAMALVSVTPVNYYQEGVTFSDTGGTIWYNNIISSTTAPIVAIEFDGVNLYLADHNFGLHKTALTNLIGLAGPVLEPDGTLKIDSEVYTLQWAGEKPWGGPISSKLYEGKLFVGMGALGMGIFDPMTMTQIGRYNLYTDTARTEDYFGAMDITTQVSSDPATGDLYLDDYTGMPDYRQVSYEVYYLNKGNLTGILTPWADFEREGKWYYEAIDVDVARQGTRTMAYIAYSLGGVIAVDITGFENASAANFMNAGYLGYFPAVPVNGPYETGSSPSSLLPYEGAGMLKESGVTAVKVSGDKVFLTDHFAGLVVLDKADAPDLFWHGSTPPYYNDTNGIANDNVPDYEDVTSYDMSPWDTLDNESLPWAFYQAPCLLATRELNGHGYTLMLNQIPTLTTAGDIDVLECSGAGGFVFVDIKNITAVNMTDRFAITTYFPTTDEVGALPDGTPGEAIAIGHSAGIDASDNYIYVSDGPHGVLAFNITDAGGYPTDMIHLVANTLQDEYPIGTVYPASHTVRNVINFNTMDTWALCNGNGMRGVPIAEVEAGLGTAGAPLLMALSRTDCYEHNSDEFSLKAFPYQDSAFDVEFRGNYAYVADGANGLTIYNITKDPSKQTSGYFVANIGKAQGEPQLGTASGIELWDNPATGKSYAVLACGPYGVGVVDITDIANMQIVKVFEPIKIEDGDVAVADGQAIDVEVIGDRAYFSYDSFGVVCYNMSDLITPVPEGVDPTNLFSKTNFGTVIYDYRPADAGRFKLQLVPGYETVDGGAVRMDYTMQNGKLYLYVAFAEAGLIKVDFTNPANPMLLARMDTAAECNDVVISNGRIFCTDGTGGLVFFK